MILTYKIKHGRDYTEELKKARAVAQHVIKHKTSSSKDVKHIGLKSVIANQILRKYGRNKTIKKVRNVNLCIPNQGIKVDKVKREIWVSCIKLRLQYEFKQDFDKINQIEIDNTYAYVAVTVKEPEPEEPDNWIGVDMNTKGHVAVMADPRTGKVTKLGKAASHIHTKYKAIRRKLQHVGNYRQVKRIKNRESRIVRDLNHKISRKIVQEAKNTGSGIKLEELKGIRKSKKHSKSFRYSLNSWSFYQLKTMIEYKAKLLGVKIGYIDPAYTSQLCSRCGEIGIRESKTFKCPRCGHVDHADSNAAFNIAERQSIDQFMVDRDAMKGCTGTPKAAMMRTPLTAEPPML